MKWANLLDFGIRYYPWLGCPSLVANRVATVGVINQLKWTRNLVWGFLRPRTHFFIKEEGRLKKWLANCSNSKWVPFIITKEFLRKSCTVCHQFHFKRLSTVRLELSMMTWITKSMKYAHLGERLSLDGFQPVLLSGTTQIIRGQGGGILSRPRVISSRLPLQRNFLPKP